MQTPLFLFGTMEIWFFIVISLSLSAFLKALLNLFFHYTTSKPKTHNLPPGPPTFPIISNILWLCRPFSELEPIIRSLHQKLGPMITLQIGSRPSIFISDRSLAYKALVQKGSVFANRPPGGATNKVLSSNQHNISSSSYGPNWRLLRRNLTAEILHPSRVKSYNRARKWVLQILINRFELASKSEDAVRVVEHLQFAMFCLLVLMCFGDKLEEKTIKEIEKGQRQMLLNLTRFNILNFWPRLSKIVLRKRWAEFLQLRKNLEDVLIPLIRARKKLKEENSLNESNVNDHHSDYVLSYVDTLLDLQLPEEKRKLNEDEIISLCNEFLNAGTDTTTTALQWIMANLVKYPEIKEKLFLEIKGVVGDEKEEVNEDDLQKMPYLKAIILEGLRRHPPGHLVVPHAVSEDTVLGDYVIPKNANINFMIADMGWDPKVWEDPMAFKPERFLKNGVESFDITGSREIKMMPFGVGRRICPGLGLAMLHLEYYVANLLWNFEWRAVDGDPVDLSEKQEFTMVMKNPLQIRVSPRLRTKVGL